VRPEGLGKFKKRKGNRMHEDSFLLGNGRKKKISVHENA
jgi:hypothetical protein